MRKRGKIQRKQTTVGGWGERTGGEGKIQRKQNQQQKGGGGGGGKRTGGEGKIQRKQNQQLQMVPSSNGGAECRGERG